MPRRYNNWSFKNVETFLKDRGFRLHHTNGSHFYYIGNGMCQVCVPFNGKTAIKPRTMKSIILQSKIDKEEWFQGV